MQAVSTLHAPQAKIAGPRPAFSLGLRGPARTRRLGTAALLPPAWLLTAKRSTLALANGDALDAAQSRQANVTPPALFSVKHVALLPPRPWPCAWQGRVRVIPWHHPGLQPGSHMQPLRSTPRSKAGVSGVPQQSRARHHAVRGRLTSEVR